MFSSILSLFTSPGLGAITGLIGSWAAKREERKILEINNGHDLEMAKVDQLRETADHQHSLALADKGIEQAALEGEIAVDIAEMGNIQTAINAQARPSGMVLVDAALRFVRPVITAYLLILISYIGYQIHVLVGGLTAIPTTEIVGIYIFLIEAIMFLTTTAVAWWFGSRGKPSARRT